MAKSPPKVPDNADDKDQSKRFIETAREHETDETGRAFEKLFKKITPTKPHQPSLEESTEPKVDKNIPVSKK